MVSEEEGAGYGACLHCTQHCYQIHGQDLSPCSRIPSFFSLLPPSPSSAPLFLPIPPAFLSGRNVRIDQASAPGERLHSQVQLEGPMGGVWPVVLEGQTLTDLAFTTGWAKFVKDHHLCVGDLLLFKLLARGSFSVSIYGRDGCEKTEVFTMQNSSARMVPNAQGSQKRPAVDNGLDCVRGDADVKRMKVGADQQIAPLIIDLEGDEDKDDDVIVVSKLETGNGKESAGVDDEDVNELSELDSSNNHLSPTSMSPTRMLGAEQTPGCIMDAKEDMRGQPTTLELPLTPSNADKSNLPVKTEAGTGTNREKSNFSTEDSASEEEAASSQDEDTENNYLEHVEKSSQSPENLQHDRLKAVLDKDYITEAFISKRRPVSDEERQKALLAAKHFKSSYPHLWKLMKESHVYRGFWLSFPSDFSSKYLTSEIQEATLLDSAGRAWSARWLGGRNGLSGGWRKFSLDHGLEEGDVCVFELIDGKKLVIKVHIFRVVELRNSLPGRDHYVWKPPTRPGEARIGYNSRRPSTPVKKMRGAIACKNTNYVHFSQSSSKYEIKQCRDLGDIARDNLEKRLGLTSSRAKVGQAENEMFRYRSGTDSRYLERDIVKRPLTLKELGQAEDEGCRDRSGTDFVKRLQTLKELRQGEDERCRDRSGTDSTDFVKRPQTLKEPGHTSCQVTMDAHDGMEKKKLDNETLNEFVARRYKSVNVVSTDTSKASSMHGMKEGGCSDAERSLDVGAGGKDKSLNPYNAAEDLSSLNTPPKTREPVPDNLRLKYLGKAGTKQLDPLPSSALKLASTFKEHTDVSKAKDCQKYYTVERLFNRRKGIVEEEFLVELEIKETLTSSSSRVKREGSAWWVPLSHFTKDKMSCHL